MPMQLFLFAHIVILIIMSFANKWMQKLGFTLGTKDIEIDEDLPNFFKAVSLGQANEVVMRDQYLMDVYGF